MEINHLVVKTGEWADKTFPKSTNDTIMSHIREEIEELAKAKDVANLGEEAADIVLLISHLCYRNHIDLDWELQEKLAKNMQRMWNTEPEPGGHFKHKKEDE